MARHDDEDLAGYAGDGRGLKKTDNKRARPVTDTTSARQLRVFVERIERLEEEKKTIADDIKDVYGEAKAEGFDPKIIKKVIALRKKDDQERMEETLVLDTYLQALGMIESAGEEE